MCTNAFVCDKMRRERVSTLIKQFNKNIHLGYNLYLCVLAYSDHFTRIVFPYLYKSIMISLYNMCFSLNASFAHYRDTHTHTQDHTYRQWDYCGGWREAQKVHYHHHYHHQQRRHRYQLHHQSTKQRPNLFSQCLQVRRIYR